MTSRNEKGFTLIEMSIVLVLIGLIIGGILKGQEMINATRLKMTVNQWDGIKAAWNAFEDKYNGIPGDYNRAVALIRSTNLTNGNGNNVIAVGSEAPDAWDHLSASNLMAGIDFAGGATGGRMRGKVRGTEFLLTTDLAADDTDGWEGDGQHWAILVASSSAAAPVTIATLHEALTGEQAYEIDRKYDDEQPEEGEILFSCEGTAGGAIPATTTALTQIPNCALMMAVGG